MGLAITIILLFIAGAAYATAGGFATNSAIRTTKISGYKQNPKLTSAHKWLSIAAGVTWGSIALIILGIIMLIFFGPEVIEASEASEAVAGKSTTKAGTYVLYGLLFLIMVGVITVGILSAIAARDINSAGVQDDDRAARQATIAAVIAIPVFVLVLIVLIVQFTYKPKKKQTEQQFLAANFADV